MINISCANRIQAGQMRDLWYQYAIPSILGWFLACTYETVCKYWMVVNDCMKFFYTCVAKMPQWIRLLAVKANDLSLILRTHKME